MMSSAPIPSQCVRGECLSGQIVGDVDLVAMSLEGPEGVAWTEPRAGRRRKSDA